MYVNPWHACTF